MRTIYLWSLSLLLFCCSGVSSASTLTYWDRQNIVGSDKYTSATTACNTFLANGAGLQPGQTFDHVMVSSGHWVCRAKNPFQYFDDVFSYTVTCPYGDNGAVCNASCDAPKTMVDGQCVDPPADPCLERQGQATPHFEQFPSYGDYQANCKVSVDGCQVDVCSGSGSTTCGSKPTGEFACWGSGAFTGESSTGTDTPTSPPDPESPPPPTTSSSSSDCTAPQVNGGTTTYTCVNDSNSSQFSSSDCAVGTVNGVTGLHCTPPDYVPESDDRKVTDDVTETTNPDGSKTTVTESTTDRTTCKGGTCTTTSTTTTTTTTTDAAGNTTDETTTCTGDKCDNPATEEDESEEEEEVERTVAGEDCGGTLSCEGDAIDCAVLNQQKLMRCSMDWETQKGAVLAEAGKADYELQTDEIDAGSLFNGPSASRWLSPSCPADRTVHLSLTNSSIVFSWQFVCDYASGLGNLLVALASLFFAVYVGRAWGG